MPLCAVRTLEVGAGSDMADWHGRHPTERDCVISLYPGLRYARGQGDRGDSRFDEYAIGTN